MKDFFTIVTNEETICVRKDSICGYRFDDNLLLTLILKNSERIEIDLALHFNGGEHFDSIHMLEYDSLFVDEKGVRLGKKK